MARIASGTIDVAVKIVEADTAVGAGGTARLPHEIIYHLDMASGTADGEINRVHSFSSTLTTTPTDIDLVGALTSGIAGGAVTSFVDFVGYILHNQGTVDVQLGGDAASIAIFGAAADFILLPPGIHVWFAPAGKVPVATTGDILQIAAASATCAIKLILLGRSA